MASILKVDALQGITSAGDITVTSEGGAATQSLQQGLAKMWTKADQTGTVEIDDSFNTSSITDFGTGLMNFTAVNNMSSIHYIVSLCYQPVATNAGSDHFNVFANQSTASNEARHFENNNTYDLNDRTSMRHGDLA